MGVNEALPTTAAIIQTSANHKLSMNKYPESPLLSETSLRILFLSCFKTFSDKNTQTPVTFFSKGVQENNGFYKSIKTKYDFLLW